MLVKVITLTGDEIEVEAEPTDTVETVKLKLEESEGIPVDQQRLMFQGKKMRDDHTLESYRAYPGVILHLIIALRGGLRYAEQESRHDYYAKYIGSKFL